MDGQSAENRDIRPDQSGTPENGNLWLFGRQECQTVPGGINNGVDRLGVLVLPMGFDGTARVKRCGPTPGSLTARCEANDGAP